jgi:hypothetical protein
MEKSICFVMSLQIIMMFKWELMLWIADPIGLPSSCCETWRKRKSLHIQRLSWRSESNRNTNVGIFSQVISSDTPLIGIEPSAILTFRDEYIRWRMIKKCRRISKKCVYGGRIFKRKLPWTRFIGTIFGFWNANKFNGHCHQKALSTIEATDVESYQKIIKWLSIILAVGMAGSLDMKRSTTKSVCKWGGYFIS